MTSAQVDLFGNDRNLRVYYDGKHTDFEDTGDVINTSNPGEWTMVQGDTANGGNWVMQVKAANPQGGEGSFFIVVGSVNGVGGKKIAVKHSDGEWIADNTALSIAQSVTMGLELRQYEQTILIVLVLCKILSILLLNVTQYPPVLI